jgi:hypothetical protein
VVSEVPDLVRIGCSMELDSLVDEGIAALRRAADAAASPKTTSALARELELAWSRRPWTIGLHGELADVTKLLDFLSDGLFPNARRPGCAAIRLRRGERDRFVVLRDEMAPEEYSKLTLLQRAKQRPLTATEIVWALPRRRGLARLFAWLRALFARLFGRRREELPAPPAAEVRSDPVEFAERLRQLSSGDGDGARVAEIAVHVATGPLAPELEIVELADPALGDDLDAILTATSTGLAAGGHAIGGPVHAVASLRRLVPTARALRLVDSALAALAEIVAAVDAEEAAAVAALDGRVAELDARRVADPAELVRVEIDRVRPQIDASVAMVLEHAATHLGADLAHLGAEWIAAIEGVSTGGELGSAVAKINETSAASVRSIAEDVRILVMGGVGGCVRDLRADAIKSLAGAAEESRPARTPPLPVVQVLPSLADPKPHEIGSAGWFGALFRSLESRRADIRGKVAERIAHVTQVANAEMRDAEPTLHAAVGDALAAELAAEIDRHHAWIDRRIAEERDAFARALDERAARRAMIDRARADLGSLAQLRAALAAREPNAARAGRARVIA